MGEVSARRSGDTDAFSGAAPYTAASHQGSNVRPDRLHIHY